MDIFFYPLIQLPCCSATQPMSVDLFPRTKELAVGQSCAPFPWTCPNCAKVLTVVISRDEKGLIFSSAVT